MEAAFKKNSMPFLKILKYDYEQNMVCNVVPFNKPCCM